MTKNNKPICRSNNLYAKYEVSSFTSSWENVTQIYLEKTEKWINEGKNKTNEPDSL